MDEAEPTAGRFLAEEGHRKTPHDSGTVTEAKTRSQASSSSLQLLIISSLVTAKFIVRTLIVEPSVSPVPVKPTIISGDSS